VDGTAGLRGGSGQEHAPGTAEQALPDPRVEVADTAEPWQQEVLPDERGEAAADGWKREAGRLAAMVAGLNAVVWERDPETLHIRWVSERIEEVLGYPAEAWRSDPDLWRRVLHPADRDQAVAAVRRAVADRSDFSLGYRAIAADGRLVWLHHFGHVAVDRAGRPDSLHAVLVDVTPERRREQAVRLSAAVGHVLADPGPLAGRLQRVVDLLVGELCDQAVVWLRDDDGGHRAVAAAPPTLAEQLLALAPVTAPPDLAEAYERGEPFVLGAVTDEMVRASTDDEAHYAAAAAAGSAGSLLVVPLTVSGGPVLGVLTMDLLEGGRRHDAEDTALAADLARRIAVTVAAERGADRQHRLHQLSVALSAAGSVAEAATALAQGIREALGASTVTVCTIGEDGLLRPVETLGVPRERLDRFAAMRLTAPFPLTVAARTRTPQWLPDRRAWTERFPELTNDLKAGTEAGAAIPLVAGDRVVGAVGVSFRTPRVFDPDTRAFLLTLASQVAVAVERAALADVRGEIAETLQRSLLPRSLPELDRLAVAARYLPGVRGTRAGGDWYDVLPREDGVVALAVGDVVGEGPSSAAVMGQLRSALAGFLLEGHEPARALDLLDRYARSVDGAQVSTVTCLLLDPVTGSLLHASAGHPPPLVVEDDGAEYLTGGEGPALALPGRAAHTQARSGLRPGSTLLLYTDGLVERRNATLDDGMVRLAEVASAARGGSVDGLVATLLERLVGRERSDDVAVVAARLVPAPLELSLVGDASRLWDVRARVRRWAALAALDTETTDDLLLAVGEAAANAVEHAYDGAPGPLHVLVALVGGARVEVTVSDEGQWRPPPAHPGFRGRGLDLMRRLSDSVDLDRREGGTVVRMGLPLPSTGDAAADEGPADGEGRAAAVTVTDQDGERCVALFGDLDLAGVSAVRGTLLAEVRAPATVVLDLTGLTALSSSGLGLLLEAVRSRGSAVRVQLPESGPIRRLLDLTGMAAALGGQRLRRPHSR
jgi:anti-anti-sigma factor